MRNRNSRLIWSLAAVAVALAAQTQNAPNQAPAAVSGSVTNLLTGEPIERAHVSLTQNGDSQRGAVTDAQGKFAIGDLQPGTYNITITRAGFVAGTGRDAPPGLQLHAGSNRSDLKLTLAPGGAITGRVLDADGGPVEGVRVEALSGGPRTGMNNSSTDGTGAFRIGGLWPGKYRVLATPQTLPIPPEIRTDGTKEDHYSPTYYGGTTSEAGAARVDVRAGNETGGVEIRLTRTPLVNISGKVIGFPAGMQQINVQLRSSKGMASVSNGSGIKKDGTFHIWRADPGKYTLTAMVYGAQLIQSAPVDVEVAGRDIENVELRMVPSADLTGSVEYFDEDEKKAPPVRNGNGPPTPMPLRILVSEVSAGAGSSRMAVANADGTFVLKGLPPSRWRVSPQWSTVYTRSLRLGSEAIEGDVFDVRNGAEGQTLAVVLSSGVGSISGVVKDASGPVAGIPVVLAVDREEGTRVARWVRSGKDGSYQIPNVPPGKYRLMAVDPDDSGALQGAGLEAYEDVTEKIDLNEKDKVTRDLKRVVR